MTVVFLLATIALLIFVNGFYVAAEFSSVVSRRPRLAKYADDGNTNARFILKIVEAPRLLDAYVATCQVGITVSSLALGFYAQARVIELLTPLIGLLNPGIRILVASVASIAVLLLLTIVQVILGELLPKNIALMHPERLAILTSTGMRWSMLLMRPLIWLLNGSAMLFLRIIRSDIGSENARVHSAAEIEILLVESSAGGVLDEEERRLLVNTLRLRNVTAQRVMIPRNSMVSAPVSASCEELFALLAESPYSRLPLFSDSIDRIVGAVHLKDLLCAVHANSKSDSGAVISAEQCLNPVLFVPETADVGDVMSSMQAQHQNLAIVVDEYGGTAGLIALEDLVEEIVGEFNDEFDSDDASIEITDEGRLRLRGDIPISELKELLGIELDSRGVETVSGLVLAASGRIPKTGDVVDVQGIPIKVDRVITNRIAGISVDVTDERMPFVLARLEGR